jgi:hypothetical protein
MDLAVPTVRDLEALPDGTTLELTRPDCPQVTYVWRAKVTRVPFVRFWVCRPGASRDTVAATSTILATQVWGWVVDYGDVAVPVVTLPEVSDLTCSDCAVLYVRDLARSRWTCPSCEGWVTDEDVAHLRRGGGR